MQAPNKWYKNEDRKRTPAEKHASFIEMGQIVTSGRPLGSVARKYLESRKVWLPEYLSEIRWNQSPWHGLIALIRKKPGGRIVGCQVTCLSPDGEKVARRNFGELEGGAIWLGEADEWKAVRHQKPGCIVGEGLETVLSAMTMLGKTQGLACMSWHNVIKAPVLPHWEVVVIAKDNDEYGEKAAIGLRRRLEKMKKARRLITHGPSLPHNDWNDALCQSVSDKET